MKINRSILSHSLSFGLALTFCGNIQAADLTKYTLDTRIDSSIYNVNDFQVYIPPAPKLEQVYVQKWGKDTRTCGSSTRPCASIKQGVYRVASTLSPYSTSSVNNISVGPGVYQENVVINKTGINITSTMGADATIITASNTNLDAVRISADGVYFGNTDNGFTLTGSVGGSGLYSTGSFGKVEGNIALENGMRGFSFGYLSDNPVTNTKVSHNVAESNAVAGFYFYDFDNSVIDHNISRNSIDAGGSFFAVGSGFWIDSSSNDVVFEYNTATENEASGVFYRRFGVIEHTIRHNKASRNGWHGFMFMGDELKITNNVSVNNEGDGFHFMGYDYVEYFTYNSAIGNTGIGVVFGNQVTGATVDINNVHHNNYVNNDSTLAAGHNNCGMENNFQAGGLVSSNDFWGNMYTAGPGADPADDVCGLNSTVNTPTTTMNTFPLVVFPYFPIQR